VSTEELAAWLGVPSEVITCLVAAGKGPRRYKVGREIRYLRDDIPRWLAEIEASCQGGSQSCPRT
jgi:hypothetical protein